MVSEERVAMEEFCADAFPRLVGALALHCGDVHVAEELAQESLLRACRRWSTVGQLESPGGWAFRVGANLASNHLRRLRAERRARRRLAADGSGQQPTLSGTVVENLAMHAALARLTDSQRQAVILRFYFGMSSAEAAAVLHSTPGAVRGLVHRALRELRKVLGPETGVHIDEEATDVS